MLPETPHVDLSDLARSSLIPLAIDELPDTSVLIFDPDLRYVMVRGGAVRDNGALPQEWEGRIAPEVMAAHRWEFYRPLYLGALRGETATAEITSPDGMRRYLVRVGPIAEADGRIRGGVLVASDITELRDARRAQADSERRFRLAMASAPIGMAVVSLDREFIEVNDSLCRMLQRRRSWLLEHRIQDILHAEDDRLDLEVRADVLSGGRDSATQEKRLIRADGECIWVQHSVAVQRDEDGTPMMYVSQFVDITDARSARERLRDLATTDQLTGLPNRADFMTRMQGLLTHPTRSNSSLALMYLDLDRFKDINDTHGHAFGDHVLRVVGQRIRARLRAGDLVSRFGGDEFVVALGTLHSEEDALRVAGQLHAAMTEPVSLDGVRVSARLSIGVVVVPTGSDLDEALRRADSALYRAKAAGGGATVLAD